MARAYEYLRGTLPFRRWKLPHADAFSFRVTDDTAHYGMFDDKDGRGYPTIDISAANVQTTHKLLETMAHEMVHFQEFKETTRQDHGPVFKRLAALVCRRHGFKLKGF